MLRYASLLAVLSTLACSAGARQPEVVVSAAASLSDVLQTLAQTFETRAAVRIALNFGASNTLARQISAGARVDLFISADEAQMDIVAGQLEPGTRVDLLSNQLAIAVADDRPQHFASVRDLAAPRVRRIAMGDPEAVPAGVYAKAYLRTLGVWDAIAPKVIPAGSVRLALAAVENGAADAALVYKTDIGSARRAREAYVVPAADGPRIRYPAAIVSAGPGASHAKRFLEFLASPEATQVFERAGFLRP